MHVDSTAKGRGPRGTGVVLDNKIRLLEEIGRGGMGAVFRAHDESLDRAVAVKFILPELGSSLQRMEGFRREAKAMASVRHENVGRLYSWGTYGSSSYLVMEFIEGVTVGQALDRAHERKARLSLPRALNIITSVARGLDAIHQAGVVHRDIKPDNFMIDVDTQRVVIVDFGISKRYETGDNRRTEYAAGSPAYMAPEVLMNQAISSEQDKLADIYALGVSAFEILTGSLPFDGSSWAEIAFKHVNDAPPSIRALRQEVPPMLEEVVLRCLEKNPENRFQSCKEMTRALEPVLMITSTKPLTPIPIRRNTARQAAHEPKRWSHVAELKGGVVISENDTELRGLVHDTVVTLCPSSRFDATRTNMRALELARKSPPDVMIASLNDESLNGLELAAMLQSYDELRSVKLILTAGRPTAGDLRTLSRFKVARVLLKPFSQDEIYQALVDLLGTRRVGSCRVE